MSERKIANAECHGCHEIWPKNEMSQLKLTTQRTYISGRGRVGASYGTRTVWVCPSCASAQAAYEAQQRQEGWYALIGFVLLIGGALLAMWIWQQYFMR